MHRVAHPRQQRQPAGTLGRIGIVHRHRGEERIEVEVGGAEPVRLLCRTLVNSAGLHAPRLGRAIQGMPPDKVPGAYYAKGNYFSLVGRSPFSRLIYPVPVPGGLGTHLTIDLGGQARFGPDVEWVDGIDYEVDPRRGEADRRARAGPRAAESADGRAGRGRGPRLERRGCPSLTQAPGAPGSSPQAWRRTSVLATSLFGGASAASAIATSLASSFFCSACSLPAEPTWMPK